MIKKAALSLVTFGLLVAAYHAYVQGFAAVTRYLAARGTTGEQFSDIESASSIRSRQLALDNFGPDHFSSRDVKLTYYDQSRGSYMYAMDYRSSTDGKTMELVPFAMISVSRDGKSCKTVTSEKAVITFNQPYGLISKGTEPQRVTHAELVGNVQIRDDKGTPTPLDDLLIGPLTGVAFDEKSMQVTTKSDVMIQDQDMRITGTEMMIQLRQKTPVTAGSLNRTVQAAPGRKSNGFEAKTAFLYRNVHIVIKNVTPGGILPGQSKPDAEGQTPLDLRCAGEMRVDLPEPLPEPAVGPPNPYREPEPTYARFDKHVRVIRGISNPDQLNCDKLNLTFKPDKKQAFEASIAADSDPDSAAARHDAAASSGGPMTQLKLRTALAQGEAVWIQSESQGLKVQCVEMKHDKKLADGQPDKTYLNGGSKRPLYVEKTDLAADGPKAGSVKSVMFLHSVDAEILDYGQGVNRIVARGPGRTEDRPSRSESKIREAFFENDMTLVTTREATKAPAGAGTATAPPAASLPLRRVVTLTGSPKLKDYKSSTTLDAKEKIVAEFESAPKAGAGPGGDGPSRIKWLQATDNAHITTPGRTLTAYQRFDAVFVPSAVPEPTPAGPAAAAAPAPVAMATTAGDALPEAKPDAPPTPLEGAVDGRANFVHATIVQGAGDAKSELREAFLRGDVMVHQDPNPGEFFGKNAGGEALDLFNQGKGMMKFAVATEEPQSNRAGGKTRLAAGPDPKGDPARSRLASRTRTPPKMLAWVEFDGKKIESERIIWFDQQANYAYALGHGSLVQMADPGLLDDKGLASDRPRPRAGQAPGVRDKLTISWNEEMKFYGRSRDKQNREVAKAEFRGSSEPVQTPDGRVVYRRGVEAAMTDAGIFCDTMDVYMDKTIDFSKTTRSPAGPKLLGDAGASRTSGPAEPQAEIAMMECWGDNVYDGRKLTNAGVDISSVKFFPETRIMQDKYRIRHTHVIYDKRTGDFEGSGAGTVFLYQGALPKAAGAVARNASSTAASKPGGAPQHTMKLTKIQFTQLMKGRMGMARKESKPETKVAEFLGNVQTANAVVASGNSDLDFDRLDQIPDAVFLTSDALRVQVEPAPVGSKANDHQLLYAAGNAGFRTVDRVVEADRITYDSATDLMYAYGDDDKGVVLVEQKSPGQPPNRMPGKALYGNKTTKQFQMVDPQSFQLFDLKSGIRPVAVYPDLGGSAPKPDPAKPKRTPFQRPAKNSTERNGFTGH